MCAGQGARAPHARRYTALVTPAQLEEIWSTLDREHLSKIAHGGPPPVFVTGSCAWG